MTILPLPFAVVYAMLAGVLLALVVATVLNRWSPRVFFLLALRLAIGWHFLFEGLHKVHSHSVGPTDANPRTFSSEPYFRAAPGPVGAFMRRQFEDPAEVIVSKVRPKENVTPEAFAKLTGEQQAAACPDAVAKQLDEMEGKAEEAVKAEAEKELKDADADETKALAAVAAAEAKGLQEAKTDDEKAKVKARADADRAKVKADADKARQAARKKADSFKEGGHALVTAAKATYARWVYGVDGRPARVKFVSGDVLLSAPQRLEHIEWLRKEVKAADDRRAAGLGNGTGTEQKRAAELRTDLVTAESDLARDANAFVAELQKDLNGGKAPEQSPPTRRGDTLDKVTMWFLVAVGACLIAGLFTRVACLLAAGFLVVTYLAFPAFPWLVQPPNTEGNPLFVNKNVIECLALLVLMCYPTGRWLGLDAIVLRPFRRYRAETPAA